MNDEKVPVHHPDWMLPGILEYGNNAVKKSIWPTKQALTSSHYILLNIKMVSGIVTRLSNVVNDVKSSFTLNCTASNIVFAAIGIAAKRILGKFIHLWKLEV